MAHRTFNLTLASDSVYRNLYTLLLATTGAIPTDGILPDRVNALTILTNPDGTNDVRLTDRNSANNAGMTLAPGQNFERTAIRNTICVKDYLITGNAEVITVDMEFN